MLLGSIIYLFLGVSFVKEIAAQRSQQGSSTENSFQLSFNSVSNNNNNNDDGGGNGDFGNFGYDGFGNSNFNDGRNFGRRNFGRNFYPGSNYYNDGPVNFNGEDFNQGSNYFSSGNPFSLNGNERGRPIIASVTFQTAPDGPNFNQLPNSRSPGSRFFSSQPSPPPQPPPPFPQRPFNLPPPQPSQILPVPVPMPMPVPLPIPPAPTTTSTTTSTTTTTPPPEATTTTTTAAPPSTSSPESKQSITHISIIAPPAYLSPLHSMQTITSGSFDPPVVRDTYMCPCNSCNSPYYV